MPVHKENSRPDFYQKGAKKRIILQGFTHTTKWLNRVWAEAPSTAKTIASVTPRLDSTSEEHFQYKAAPCLSLFLREKLKLLEVNIRYQGNYA